MPFPIAHSLAGSTIYAGLDADGSLVSWRRLLLAVIIANAPDLDFIPGILIGIPHHFHQGATHSLTMVVLVAALAALVASVGRPWPLMWKSKTKAVAGTALIVGLLWASHMLLDLFTASWRRPSGLPLLWPFSDQRFHVGSWFPYVAKLPGRGDPATFFLSLLHPHNLWTLSVEFLTLAPLLMLVVWIRNRRR